MLWCCGESVDMQPPEVGVLRGLSVRAARMEKAHTLHCVLHSAHCTLHSALCTLHCVLQSALSLPLNGRPTLTTCHRPLPIEGKLCGHTLATRPAWPASSTSGRFLPPLGLHLLAISLAAAHTLPEMQLFNTLRFGSICTGTGKWRHFSPSLSSRMAEKQAFDVTGWALDGPWLIHLVCERKSWSPLGAGSQAGSQAGWLAVD